VMGFVDGLVLDSASKGAVLSVERRRAAGFDLIDVLADLHAVDVDAVGLGDLAKRDGYVERQVKRWSTQWERSKTRELPAVEEVARRLAERFPEQQGVSIAHGDYRFGNVLTDVDEGRINAVLDWELCTLGDPLADVGYVGVYWADPGTAQSRPNDPTGIEGFPTYAELLERYATRTGRDLSQIDYYLAFGSFRDLRGRLCPLPSRRHGRPGNHQRTARSVQGRHRDPRGVSPRCHAAAVSPARSDKIAS
jgi:aminoglycoside phosphotransferase (APT) family kinase protein